MCVLCFLAIESFFKKSNWEIPWSWLICSPFHTQTIVWMCFPRGTGIMSWAPSPESAACTKGTVHLSKSLLDFHLTLELFCFVQTSMQNVPIPKEKQRTKRGTNLVVVCQCSTETLHPKRKAFGKLLTPFWVADHSVKDSSSWGCRVSVCLSRKGTSGTAPLSFPVSTMTFHPDTGTGSAIYTPISQP